MAIVPFGEYQVRIQYHSHPLGSADCLNPQTKTIPIPHINVAFEKRGSSDSLFNLHLGAYEHEGYGGKCVLAFEDDFFSKVANKSLCINICQDDVKRTADAITDFVTSALTRIFNTAKETAKENGPEAALAAAIVAAVTYVGLDTIVSAIVAAWLIPFVPPPP